MKSQMKPTKKNTYQLKFDTSKNNLQCFIKKKSISLIQNDKNSLKYKHNKSKTKSVIKKQQQFHQAKFITSIIKNAMQDQFQDTQQLTQLFNKVNLQGQEIYQSPTNADQALLKTMEIFKHQQGRSLTPQIRVNQLDERQKQKYKNMSEKKQSFFNKQQQFAFGKQHLWHNFSTQMGTDIDTQRSRRQQITKDEYPSILQSPIKGQLSVQVRQQHQVTPIYDQKGIQQYMQQQYSSYLLSQYLKQNPNRKSTPIRGQNQQFRIILDNIQNDERTTLMIRHIPNKYTQQMLIDEINVNHKLKYNFFYLPLDSYNPCNVGYAFINFIDTKFIKKFYLEFNGARWARYNSQKRCQLAYGRIQGSTALINHFQHSNVMNAKDKRIRPFVSFGDGYSNNSGR